MLRQLKWTLLESRMLYDPIGWEKGDRVVTYLGQDWSEGHARCDAWHGEFER
jgi:hypothetical protein